ncbi:2TM domain-containing protein [Gillisia sp. Q332]|uniref:2TM domain-containing protein n=1 Tax=Gillisia xinjiangensis TaxID=3384765 RepID=UPI00391D84F4
MFSKKKNTSKLDTEQREMYEYARKRALQKRRLFQHFVVFLVGAVLLIVINVVIGYREDLKPLGYDWFVWAILLWTFFFLIHMLNVLVIDSFMGKEWEQKQLERLVRKQRDRIEEMQKKVEKEHPEPKKKEESKIYEDPAPIRIQENDPRNPDKPLNH